MGSNPTGRIMQFVGDIDYPMLGAKVLGTVRFNDQVFYLLRCSIREGDFQILSNGDKWHSLEEDRISYLSKKDKYKITDSITAYLE